MSSNPKSAIVEQLNYHPAHTAYISTPGPNNTTKMTPIHSPERWSADVKIEQTKELVNTGITQKYYNELEKGEIVTAYISKGRLSGNTYCEYVVRDKN